MKCSLLFPAFPLILLIFNRKCFSLENDIINPLMHSANQNHHLLTKLQEHSRIISLFPHHYHRYVRRLPVRNQVPASIVCRYRHLLHCHSFGVSFGNQIGNGKREKNETKTKWEKKSMCAIVNVERLYCCVQGTTRRVIKILIEY